MPGDACGQASGGGKAAEDAGATLICTITAPVAFVRGQDELLTVTPLALPFQKPLKQFLLQPDTARHKRSTTGKALRRTFAAVSVAPVRSILGLTSRTEIRIALPEFIVWGLLFLAGGRPR